MTALKISLFVLSTAFAAFMIGSIDDTANRMQADLMDAAKGMSALSAPEVWND